MQMFEVNETVDSLIQVDYDESFAPDFGWDDAVEVYRDGDDVWMLFRDFVRAGCSYTATDNFPGYYLRSMDWNYTMNNE